MPRSEAETRRELIDPRLEAAGWILQDRSQINLSAGRGVAVREFPLKNGFADYLRLSRAWNRTFLTVSKEMGG